MKLIRFLLGTIFCLWSASNVQADDMVQVTLNSQMTGPVIPADYCGLSYETRMMLPDAQGRYYFSPDNQKLVRMFQTLGVKSLRLGGNSVDVSSTRTPSEKDIDALFAFARKAGVKVIYSVRLQDGSVEDAVSQARYIYQHYADQLDYFAIGNEPGYYKDYERQLRPRWEQLMKAMREVAPNARFCAPDDNPNPVLCQKLVRDFWQRPLQLLTMHSYPAGCAYKNPGDAVKVPYDYRERCDYLLSDELPKEYGTICQQMSPVFAYHPFRLSETNNYWYGGLDGASNAYATALWAVDYMYWWAQRGNLGMNFHTGDRVGGTDIAAHYASFITEGNGFDIRPLSYGIKLFTIGAHGQMFPVTLSDNRQLTAYATRNAHGQINVTIINKEHGATAKNRSISLQMADASVPVLAAHQLLMECQGGDILARQGITIGGEPLKADGTWSENGWKNLETNGRNITLQLPPASAVVVRIETSPYHAISESNEPMQQGYIKPKWSSMQKYEVPAWYKNAKFGIWAHWGPQSQPEYGDWYAYYMYKQGGRTQKYHLEHYGHPSEVGFKDVIHQWQAKAWNPEQLVKLYKRAGAQYFVAMANHHDNFDLWDSHYQEWNATAEGPHKNIIGHWAKAARKAGMRFGVSVHSSRAWEWYNMTENSDATGDKAGVTYDGRLTKADGRGTWWEGKDPRQLYARGYALQGTGAIGADGQPAAIPDSAWCEQFYNRTMDLINNYQPDLVYFDDTQLPLWPSSDAGLRIAAHYYNSNRMWHNGKQEGVITAKKLTPEQQRCLVWDVECGSLDSINAQPWQTCSCLGTWHYDRTWYQDNKYKSAQRVVRMLVDIVSKNGNLLLSVPIRADGTIDEREEAILDSLAVWMKTNGESIFDTHPWRVFGEGPDAETIHPMRDGIGFNESKKVYNSRDIRFTQKGNTVYAILMVRPADGQVLIRSMAGAAEDIKSVQVLGKGRIRYTCDEQGLALTLPAGVCNIPVVKITLRQP